MSVPSKPVESRLLLELEQRFSCWGRLKSGWHVTWRRIAWSILLFVAGAKRGFDVLVAGGLLIASLPIFFLLAAAAGGPDKLFASRIRLGRWAEPFEELRLETPLPRLNRIIRALGLGRLPILINILRGDCSFVGPRAVAPGELDPAEREIRRRFDVRPGLISLWWIRTCANIGFDGEIAADAEYAAESDIKQDVGILLRALPALVYGENLRPAKDRVTILGIPIENLTMTGAIDWMLMAMRGSTPRQVCFVNADCANIARTNPEYLALLNSGTLNLPDGIGLKLAGKALGREIRQNVNGTDLYPRMMKAIAGTGLRVFFLGARPGVVDDLVANLRREHPGVEVAGFHHGYFSPEEEAGIIAEIAASKADLLLVAFGAPRQDLWIARHLPNLRVHLAMGVGGLFDFFSGRMPRAPQWVREIGMEWFFRFTREPGRMWKRYFVGNVVFLYRVFWEKLAAMSSHIPKGEA